MILDSGLLFRPPCIPLLYPSAMGIDASFGQRMQLYFVNSLNCEWMNITFCPIATFCDILHTNWSLVNDTYRMQLYFRRHICMTFSFVASRWKRDDVNTLHCWILGRIRKICTCKVLIHTSRSQENCVQGVLEKNKAHYYRIINKSQEVSDSKGATDPHCYRFCYQKATFSLVKGI